MQLRWPAWIGVVVDDLEGQRRFWGELLGVPEAGAGPDYVEFDAGDGRTFEVLKRSRLRSTTGAGSRSGSRSRTSSPPERS